MDPSRDSLQTELEPKTIRFYHQAMQLLERHDIPFLAGGAYALSHYTGIERHTKDLDVFLLEQDVARALHAFAEAGYKTELTFPNWLGKAYAEDAEDDAQDDGDFIDIIFSSRNGVAKVDDDWFRHSVEGEALGMPVRLAPPEEMIWSKAFIMERERYDGADIAHLLHARADTLDWPRLLRRFEGRWRVLLSHLLLFGFIYPSERAKVPDEVMLELLEKAQRDLGCEPPNDRLCHGTILSGTQYRFDLEHWGYKDALEGDTA